MRRGVLVLTAMLFVLGTTGTNLGPALVDERPRLVLLLSSRNRNLLGAAPYLDAGSFFAIGFVRILLAAVALYLVGRWYGDATVRWVERRAGGLPAEVRWIERLVARSQTVAVLVFPGSNVVNVLVGHAKMPPRRFVPLVCAGIAGKLAFYWWLGDLFADEIRAVIGWIDRWQWWLVAALFALSLLRSIRRR
jgi:membrane protein DedA with SNARE-associated domain